MQKFIVLLFIVSVRSGGDRIRFGDEAGCGGITEHGRFGISVIQAIADCSRRLLHRLFLCLRDGAIAMFRNAYAASFSLDTSSLRRQSPLPHSEDAVYTYFPLFLIQFLISFIWFSVISSYHKNWHSRFRVEPDWISYMQSRLRSA